MPAPRSAAIVTCSCGLRVGNHERAQAHEDMEAVELALLEREVPRMHRHWQLGHTLKLREGAPLAYAAVIAKAARELAADAEPSGDTGMVRR